MSEPSSGAALAPKRVKVKRACQHCQTSKRKCDGQWPCGNCSRYDWTCEYDNSPRARTKNNAQSSFQVESRTHRQSEVNGSQDTNSLQGLSPSEAASGVVFSNALKSHLDDSTQKPRPLQAIGWNLGFDVGETPLPIISPRPLRYLVPDINTAIRRINNFFGTVGSLFKYIRHEEIVGWCRQLYQGITSEASVYDSSLSSIVAMGMLFSSEDLAMERRQLSANGRSILVSRLSDPSSEELVVAWLCHTILLRSTGDAHSTWLSSCTTMHLAEAAGLHLTSSGEMDSSNIFWTAAMMNLWISFDTGRSPVTIRGAPENPPPAQRPSDILFLFSLTHYVCFNPDDVEALYDAFDRIEASRSNNPNFSLFRSVCAMTVFRRLFVSAKVVSSNMKSRMIAIGKEGLEAVKTALHSSLPWWHLPNTPVQFLCLLLIFDTADAFNEITATFETLSLVTQKYNTAANREAVSFSRKIVRLAQMRLQSKASVLGQVANSLTDSSEERIEGHSNFATMPLQATPFEFDPSFEWPLENTGFNNVDWSSFTNTGLAAFDFVFQPQGEEI